MARLLRGYGRSKFFGQPQFVSQEINITNAGDIASEEAFGTPFIESFTGVWPGFYVEIAFPNNALDTDANVVWTDVSEYVRSIGLTRGRSRELDRFEPGTMSLELDNRDLRFSPEYSASPYFPYVRPNKRVRVRTSHNGILRSLGNAYADSWSERFTKPNDVVTVLSATDAFKLFARYELPDAWSLAVDSLNPDAWYQLDERSGTSAFDTQRPGAAFAGTYQGNANGVNQDPIVPGANSAVSRATIFSNADTQWLTIDSADNPIPTTTTASSITFKSSSKAYNLSDPTSLAVTKPAGVVSSDVMVAFVDIKGQRSISSVPTGWALVRAAEASGSANSDARLLAYWKTAGIVEPGSYTWTQDGGGDIAIVISAFTGVDTTSPIDVSGGSNALTGSTIPAPSVTTTGANRMLVTGHAFNPGQSNTTVYSITPPAGMTEPPSGDTASQGNGVQTNNATVETAYLAIAAAGATGIKNATLDNGSGQHAGIAVALKPAAGGVGAVPTPFTIAFWIKQTAAQGNNDGYVEMGAVGGATSFRVYQDILTTGSLKLRYQLGSIVNTDTVTTPIPVNVPILVVARYDGALQAKLNTAGTGFNESRVTAMGAAVGLAASNLLVGVANCTMDEIAIWDHVLTDAEVTTLTNIATGVDTTLQVVTDVLDQIGWPSDLRQLSGTTNPVTISNLTAGAVAGTKVLDYLQQINDTERGAIYMTGDGKVAFETLDFLRTDASRITSSVTFGVAALEIRYADLAPDYSDQIIINDVKVTNTTTDAGTVNAYQETFTAQDAASIAEFSRYTLSLTTNYDNVAATRQSDINTRMQFELARYAQPQRRIQSITIIGTPASQASNWDTLIAMTMLQRVTLNHVAPNGATLTDQYTVRAFSWEYSASPQSITLTIGLDEGAV